jgi:2-polyprenyl-6-methoxyphenol hydroxylase-like FAD-dependent oxidoreductase
MTARRALISGASIAGLSTAFWLDHVGWDVTVIERAETFRDGGQNVDVRGVAREVLNRMGLTDAVRDRTTTEEGTAFVDTTGRSLARFPAGEDPDGPTAELEILRGDLAALLRDRIGEARYGQQITAITDHGTDVEVTFRSGQGDVRPRPQGHHPAAPPRDPLRDSPGPVAQRGHRA